MNRCPVCSDAHWVWFDAKWGYCSPAAACSCIYPCGDALCPAFPHPDFEDDYNGDEDGDEE
jgi:hypothetical protein